MGERLSDAEGGLACNSRCEDDFRSCCGDEDEWEDTEESFMAGVAKGELDETSVRLFFKGVSSSEAEGKKQSGIGVVMERSPGVPMLQVQKKLDFYVDELVADHLALMDGLLVALQNGIQKIFAFTNSEKLYFQIAEAEILEDQLLIALGHRILELVDKLEDFDIILLPSFELEKPLQLAKEAIGIMYLSPYEVGICPICFLLDLSQHFSRASSSSQSDLNCVECPECHRDICINCGVPWHIMMDCDEYQSLPVEERDAGDLSLHHLAQHNRWRRCQRCRRMIELTQGCFHMNCWCGHEFCYSCGAEYNNGLQTCQCVFWDEESIEAASAAAHSSQASEIWAWDTFDCMPTAIEGYSEQERAQLALIQRFLAGGFSLGDHPSQSPPHRADSYIIDTMKDLHQLPWLERFVSVISDSYNDDYIQ
ncbi:hypothetical protein GUJ93_ZPchr0012g21119 [Zizania palustris]|uniref:RBR-type E3 ubiquitin transferase n=1 Tax=Zizania palustris TaxID=103762 RepID=A0A8J5WQK7_ZIZPA|nr:hypothetical protein GUJ93_ZPchr0012g21119 [Zizania palustris]